MAESSFAGHHAPGFSTFKKEHLALEKGALADIQKAVAKNDPNLTDHLEELESIKERLKMFHDEGERLYKEFDSWALVEPRKSMGFIATKLNLGKPEAPAYVEVKAGLKTQLNDVASAISATQRVWRSDLEIALNNQIDKLDTLEKIINKDVGKTKGFLDQLDKGIDRFVAECDTAYLALKVDVFAQDASEIMSGGMAKKDKMQIEQKYQQTQQRIALLPKLVDQIDKNYGRVVKSVPPEVLNGFVGAGAKKKLETFYAAAKKKMATAGSVFDQLVKLYEKNKLV